MKGHSLRGHTLHDLANVTSLALGTRLALVKNSSGTRLELMETIAKSLANHLFVEMEIKGHLLRVAHAPQLR